MARRGKSSANGGRKDSGNNSNPPQKRHQRQRGHPDPDAKIVALAPSALMEDERFACKFCAKVFVREQNLKVHARKHHISSELKKNGGDGSPPMKKAYICPIPTCRHHDPKHALSDITGIKKHFGRAHNSTKRFACDRCDKKYAVEADLKAHAKLHLKDGQGAGAACSRTRAEELWCEGLEELANAHGGGRDSGTKDEEFAASVAGKNDNGSFDKDGTTLSLGVSEQHQDVYVPQFDVAPNYREGREQGQGAMNESTQLDLDLGLLESLPMGLTGLLTGACAVPGDKESLAGAVHSASVLDSLYAPEAEIPTVDLRLTSPYFGAHQGSVAVNHGAGMLESLSFPTAEEQYRTQDTPGSGQKESPATELVQRAVMNIGPNATVMTPVLLPNADALQMPHMMMIPSMGNYCYPMGVPSQPAMSTPNPPFSSFPPFVGGAVLMNVNNNAMVGGSSDGFFNGFFVGSANATNLQGRDLGANGSFVPGVPSVCAPQQQQQQQQVAPAPVLSYASALGGGAGSAAAVPSRMKQPWLGLQKAYAAPPPAAEFVNQCGNGAGGGPRWDIFGASGEGTSRRFEEQSRGATSDPSASSSGGLNPSFPYIGLQGGNPGGFQ